MPDSDDGELPPGPDISLAPNYRDGCVWVTTPDGRACLDPDEARELADDLDEQFDLEATDAEGYEMGQFRDRLRKMAAQVEPAADDTDDTDDRN